MKKFKCKILFKFHFIHKGTMEAAYESDPCDNAASAVNGAWEKMAANKFDKRGIQTVLKIEVMKKTFSEIVESKINNHSETGCNAAII